MLRLKSPRNLVKQYITGSEIAYEGENRGRMYVVLRGKVHLYQNFNKSDQKSIGTVAIDEYFGEEALFFNKKCSVTAVAVEDCSILLLDALNIYRFFVTEQKAAWELLNLLCARISKLIHKPSFPGNDEDVFCREVNKSYGFTFNKPTESYIRSFMAHTSIIRQGDQIDSLYIMLRGNAGINHNRKVIADIKQGNFIGPMSFPNATANDSLDAMQNTTMLVLSPQNSDTFFKFEPKSAFSVFQMFLDRINLLSGKGNTKKEGDILPSNHKKYTLPIKHDIELLQEKYFFCPVCEKSTISVITPVERLISASADDDSRLYYNEVEPIYYDIITCSTCWYTALREYFDKGMATYRYFQKTMEPLQTTLEFKQNKREFNINDVIFSYYFALFCVDECFNSDRALIHAKLWLRLSWIYNNCGDNDMEKQATEKAHEYFMQAFSEGTFEKIRNGFPLMIVTAAICNKLNDSRNARFLLSEVILKSGSEKYKERARELMKKYRLM